MHWSWKIGKLAGIDVYMHATFLLLVGFIVVASWVESHNAVRTLYGLVFVLVIFGCIVLHELGHAIGIKGHSSSKGDIMYYQIQDKTRQIYVMPVPHPLIWRTLVKEPSQRDLNTLIRLYNTPGMAKRMP